MIRRSFLKLLGLVIPALCVRPSAISPAKTSEPAPFDSPPVGLRVRGLMMIDDIHAPSRPLVWQEAFQKYLPIMHNNWGDRDWG